MKRKVSQANLPPTMILRSAVNREDKVKKEDITDNEFPPLHIDTDVDVVKDTRDLDSVSEYFVSRLFKKLRITIGTVTIVQPQSASHWLDEWNKCNTISEYAEVWRQIAVTQARSSSEDIIAYNDLMKSYAECSEELRTLEDDMYGILASQTPDHHKHGQKRKHCEDNLGGSDHHTNKKARWEEMENLTALDDASMLHEATKIVLLGRTPACFGDRMLEICRHWAMFRKFKHKAPEVEDGMSAYRAYVEAAFDNAETLLHLDHELLLHVVKLNDVLQAMSGDIKSDFPMSRSDLKDLCKDINRITLEQKYLAPLLSVTPGTSKRTGDASQPTMVDHDTTTKTSTPKPDNTNTVTQSTPDSKPDIVLDTDKLRASKDEDRKRRYPVLYAEGVTTFLQFMDTDSQTFLEIYGYTQGQYTKLKRQAATLLKELMEEGVITRVVDARGIPSYVAVNLEAGEESDTSDDDDN